MITTQEFKLMKDIARCLITEVFDNEEVIKKSRLLKSLRWKPDEYEFERVHISGTRVRITIRFVEDYSNYDVYLDLDDVYNLVCDLEKGE